MNEYIDSHCHVDSILKKKGFTTYPELKKVYPSNYEGCITISCDPNSIEPTLALMENENVYGAFGIHPHDSKHYNDELELKLIETLAVKKAVAWGEMGLDYHYNFSEPEVQRPVFERQLKKAVELGKPIIVHTREAEKDTLDIMQAHIPADHKVHVHCFTSGLNLSTQLLEHFSNLYIGFTGIITFKNSHELRKVVTHTPLERILLETDSPYLAPEPHRGKPCHSGYIPLIAEEISRTKNVPLEEVYPQIRGNTRDMYGI